ncbi:methyltransferase domain-containing protein [Rhizobium ruizarguesonis]
MVSVDRVRAFYNGPSMNVALRQDGHLHVGLFREGQPKQMRVARQRLVSEIWRRLSPSRATSLLDIGCGIGAATAIIKKLSHCRVTGITIAENQTRAASIAFGQIAGLDFVTGDAHALPFANSAFAGGYAIESLQHMQRPKVLGEVARVLQDGSSFVFCDWFAHEEPASELRELLDREMAMSVATLDRYRDMLNDSGYSDVRFTDWSKDVFPTYEFWLQAAADESPEYRALADHVVSVLAERLGYFCAVATVTKRRH